MSSAAAAGLVRDSARVLGCDLPTGYIAAIDKANQLISSAETIGDRSGQHLRTLVLDALDNNRDVHSDKAIARAALDFQLSTAGIGQAAREQAEHDIASALVEYADPILESWSHILQPHLAKLAESASELPADIDDAKAVTAMGIKALTSWASATEAIRLTKAATSGASTLARIARIALTRDRQIMLITPADPDGFDAIVRDTGRHVDTWTAARAGLPLTLIDSLGSLLERLSDYDRIRQAAIDEAEEAQAHPRKAALLP